MADFYLLYRENHSCTRSFQAFSVRENIQVFVVLATFAGQVMVACDILGILSFFPPF